MTQENFQWHSNNMGNILFPCANHHEKLPQSESVINISESCIDRLIREDKERGNFEAHKTLGIPENVPETEWMMRLKCLDDAHSNSTGITVQNFYKMADKIEGQIEPIRALGCDPTGIVECLAKNPCCAIKCEAEMKKYIDCIETVRINIIKEQIECAQKEKRKEDQEIVEEFLKNDCGGE